MIIWIGSYVLFGILAWIFSANYEGYQIGTEKIERRNWKFYVSRGKLYQLLVVFMITVLSAVLFREYNYSFLKGIRYLSFFYGVLLIARIDIRERRIPNQIILFLLFFRVVLLVAECFLYPAASGGFFRHALTGMIVGGGIFYIGYFLSKGGIGLGDVKLMIVCGAYLGASLMYTTAVVSLLCLACYGLVQIGRKKLSIKDSAPFAPFIALGTCITLLCGF